MHRDDFLRTLLGLPLARYLPGARDALSLAPGSIPTRRLGRADAPLLWPLEKGRHTLALIASDGATLDSVGFSVR